MTVREIEKIEEEVEEEELSDDELMSRLRRLAYTNPDFNFKTLEALMEHLGLPHEDQLEVMKEGARKWRNE